MPMTVLPTIKSSSEVYGTLMEGCLKGVPISGVCTNLLSNIDS